MVASRDVMAVWLVHLFPYQAVKVQVLAGDVVLCSWESHCTLEVPLSIQVFEWL